MKTLLFVWSLLGTLLTAQEPLPVSVTPLKSGVNASFRGLAVRGSKEAWVTGSAGTVIRTLNAGESWEKIVVPYEPIKDKDGKDIAMDFRDVELLPDGSVILMSIGNGAASKLFRSIDGGKQWQVVLENKDEKGFFDGLVFDKAGRKGLLFGDPLNGRLDMYTTSDGGKTWQAVPQQNRPRLEEGEYGFAASGTGAAMIGSEIWIGTGGSVARLHYSNDGGKTWTARKAPMRSGNPSSGIFSVAFASPGHGVVIGGDYLKPDEVSQNVAVTVDGGRTWVDSAKVQMPHKACVQVVGKQRFVTCGRTGIAFSADGGRSWQPVSNVSYYTCAFDPGSGMGFMAGKDGGIARFQVRQK